MLQKNEEISVNRALSNFRQTQRLAIIGGPESDLVDHNLSRNGFKIDQNQTLMSLKETQHLY
jgi:hypothetical protein